MQTVDFTAGGSFGEAQAIKAALCALAPVSPRPGSKRVPKRQNDEPAQANLAMATCGNRDILLGHDRMISRALRD